MPRYNTAYDTYAFMLVNRLIRLSPRALRVIERPFASDDDRLLLFSFSFSRRSGVSLRMLFATPEIAEMPLRSTLHYDDII